MNAVDPTRPRADVEALAPSAMNHLTRFGTQILAALAVLSTLGGCRAPSAEREPPRETVTTTSPPRPTHSESVGEEPPTGMKPLVGPWLVRLPLRAGELVVTPPVGASAPRQVMVAAHGAGDRPDWSCGGWRLASQASLFIACPQGTRMGAQSFGWSSSRALEARIEEAVGTLQQHYGSYVLPGPMLFAGFSQGANLAEPFLRKHAARFPIAILAEGGYASWRSPAFGRAYRDAGGRRVVLVCGTAACFTAAEAGKEVLGGAGLEVLVLGDPKAGHNLNQRMQNALRGAWARITAPTPS